MCQSRTRKPQKNSSRKNRDRVTPAKCTGATFEVSRVLYKRRNEREIREIKMKKILYSWRALHTV